MGGPLSQSGQGTSGGTASQDSKTIMNPMCLYPRVFQESRRLCASLPTAAIIAIAGIYIAHREARTERERKKALAG